MVGAFAAAARTADDFEDRAEAIAFTFAPSFRFLLADARSFCTDESILDAASFALLTAAVVAACVAAFAVAAAAVDGFAGVTVAVAAALRALSGDVSTCFSTPVDAAGDGRVMTTCGRGNCSGVVAIGRGIGSDAFCANMPNTSDPRM